MKLSIWVESLENKAVISSNPHISERGATPLLQDVKRRDPQMSELPSRPALTPQQLAFPFGVGLPPANASLLAAEFVTQSVLTRCAHETALWSDAASLLRVGGQASVCLLRKYHNGSEKNSTSREPLP